MAISQVVTCESFMSYLSAIRPLAQADMKRAVGAGKGRVSSEGARVKNRMEIEDFTSSEFGMRSQLSLEFGKRNAEAKTD